jgi:hypothetical protein
MLNILKGPEASHLYKNLKGIVKWKRPIKLS